MTTIEPSEETEPMAKGEQRSNKEVRKPKAAKAAKPAAGGLGAGQKPPPSGGGKKKG